MIWLRHAFSIGSLIERGAVRVDTYKGKNNVSAKMYVLADEIVEAHRLDNNG